MGHKATYSHLIIKVSLSILEYLENVCNSKVFAFFKKSEMRIIIEKSMFPFGILSFEYILLYTKMG